MGLPSEVLSLGARIVRELELDQSTNTLSRWMAHHLAETIKSAEVADEASRERLEEKAVQLILELWSHRGHLPGKVYPLAQLEDIIAILKHLQFGASPFYRQSTNEFEQLLWRVFNALQVIVIHGAIVAAMPDDIPDDFELQTSFLNDEENQTYNILKSWIEFNEPKNLRYEILSRAEGQEFKFDSMRSRIAELDELEPVARSREIVAREIEGLMETLTILQLKLSDGSCEEDAES